MKTIQREYVVFSTSEVEVVGVLGGRQLLVPSGFFDSTVNQVEELKKSLAVHAACFPEEFHIFEAEDLMDRHKIREVLDLSEKVENGNGARFKISVAVHSPSHEELAQAAIEYVFSDIDADSFDSYEKLYNILNENGDDDEALEEIFEKHQLEAAEDIMNEYGYDKCGFVFALREKYSDYEYEYKHFVGTHLVDSNNMLL